MPLQLENIGNFIKAITKYGVRPHDIFEANDLFENTNHTQVQSTLLALASMVSVAPRWAWGGGAVAVWAGIQMGPLRSLNPVWVGGDSAAEEAPASVPTPLRSPRPRLKGTR